MGNQSAECGDWEILTTSTRWSSVLRPTAVSRFFKKNRWLLPCSTPTAPTEVAFRAVAACALASSFRSFARAPVCFCERKRSVPCWAMYGVRVYCMGKQCACDVFLGITSTAVTVTVLATLHTSRVVHSTRGGKQCAWIWERPNTYRVGKHSSHQPSGFVRRL